MISVIVPYKNAEQWLDRCCRSLAQQSGDFQFILVNDHSNDDGESIAVEYASKDERFVAVNNRHKNGVSGARNTGIEKAKGTWITFLDADDEMLPNAYNAFMAVINADKKANIHQLNHMRYYTAIDKLVIKYWNNGGVYTTEALPKMWAGVWNKLYRAKFIKDIRFDEKLQYGEDGMFNLECLAKEPRIHHGDRNLTAVKHRFDNQQSLSHVKTAKDVIKQARAYEKFVLEQTDPALKKVVCDEIAGFWSVKMKELL